MLDTGQEEVCVRAKEKEQSIQRHINLRDMKKKVN